MDSLQNHFLIAMPNMADPMFSRTVTLICEHNDEGAMGIIINRATNYLAGDLLIPADQEEPAKLDSRFGRTSLHIGGPVQNERGFVLHTGKAEWEHSIQVSDNLALSSSQDILDALIKGEGPQQYLLALGFAGWGAGQLESEITENAWLHGPANADMLFSTPVEQRWTAAAKQLGIDIHLLDSHAGHA